MTAARTAIVGRRAMEYPYCHKHRVSEQDESWQVAFQELVSGEDEHIEPFHKQVCPLCFLALREKNRKNRRQLRAESKKAIRLQAEVGKLQKVIEEVALVVKNETGTDPFSLVGQVFPRPCHHGGSPGGVINQEEVGNLERILPNLIVEAIKRKKVQNPQASEQ